VPPKLQVLFGNIVSIFCQWRIAAQQQRSGNGRQRAAVHAGDIAHTHRHSVIGRCFCRDDVRHQDDGGQEVKQRPSQPDSSSLPLLDPSAHLSSFLFFLLARSLHPTLVRHTLLIDAPPRMRTPNRVSLPAPSSTLAAQHGALSLQSQRVSSFQQFACTDSDLLFLTLCCPRCF